MPQRALPRRYVNKLAFAVKTGPEPEQARRLKRRKPTRPVTARGRRAARLLPISSCPKPCFLLAIAEPLVRLDGRAPCRRRKLAAGREDIQGLRPLPHVVILLGGVVNRPCTARGGNPAPVPSSFSDRRQIA